MIPAFSMTGAIWHGASTGSTADSMQFLPPGAQPQACAGPSQGVAVSPSAGAVSTVVSTAMAQPDSTADALEAEVSCQARLGATPVPGAGCQFLVWAPFANRV